MDSRTHHHMAKRNVKENGSVMLTALIMIFLAVACGTVMMQTSTYLTRASRHRSDFIRARAIAESGANEAFSALQEDFSLSDDPHAFPPAEFAGGMYEVKVSRVNAGTAQVAAKGFYRDAETEVVIDVANNVDDDPGFGALDYTFYAAQDIFIETSSRMDSRDGEAGAIYAGRDLLIREPSWLQTTFVDIGHKIWVITETRIYGEVTSPHVYLGEQTIEKCFRDSYTQAAPREVKFPKLDLVGYYRQAQRHGQVFRQHGEIEVDGHMVIPGGVRWYETDGKDLIFPESLNWTGTIIATGNIIFEKNGMHESAFRSDGARLPAIISRDGKIVLGGDIYMHGLVYAAGDIDVHGSIMFIGTMVSGGSIRFNASFGGVTYDRYEPPVIGSETVDVHVSAWQK